MANDARDDLPKKSEVDKKLPEGHVAAREQVGEPQSLQGLQVIKNGERRGVAVVISTGHSIGNDLEREAALAANPPQPVVPAQDPTPLQAGDEIPIDPVTGQVSYQGGPSKVLSPTMPVVAGDEGGVPTRVVGEDLTHVQAAPDAPRETRSTAGKPASGKPAAPGSSGKAGGSKG